MKRAVYLLLTTVFLTGCSVWNTINPPKPEVLPLTMEEFRIAAEARVSWREPVLPADVNPADVGGERWLHGKVLSLNDLHGNLNGQSIGGRPVGGVAVLASYLEAASDEVNGRAIIVHAGDMVGASPPVSALLQDEPTLHFLNQLANESCTAAHLMAPKCNMVGTLGNHEFDEGPLELLRLLNGGRYAGTTSPPRDWAGVKFPYVSANTIVSETGKTFLPPYVIKEIGGVPVAFIGAVLQGMHEMVTPDSIKGMEFLDEAAAINSYVPELKAKNVRAIVITIHQGLAQTTFGAQAVIGQEGLEGHIIDIVTALDDEIDVVVSGHAHNFTNVLVPTASGKMILLTQAFSSGTAYGDIDITIDRMNGDIVEMSASIATTWADQGPGLAPDTDIASFVDATNAAVSPLVNRVVGFAETHILLTQNAAGESALGDLITDAGRAAMGAEFAFIGSGGIRGNIFAGDIRWGSLSTIHPFGNDMVALSLTGAQVVRLLNQQWREEGENNILQVSGLRYTWDASLPVDKRLVDVRDADGNRLDVDRSYRVAVPNFYFFGGGGFSVFGEGTDLVIGPLDLEALIDHISAQSKPVTAPAGGRITRRN